jgi:predicted nucleic acid-binding protein
MWPNFSITTTKMSRRQGRSLTWLFDVNVLIAIADSNHIFHQAIHGWLASAVPRTWASCPITENGRIRVLSQSAYRDGTWSPAEAIAILRKMKEARPWKHVFWADDFSVTDSPCHHTGLGAILAERVAGQSRSRTSIWPRWRSETEGDWSSSIRSSLACC